jgi:peptide/nickel transport system substrate-binding protein
MTGRRTGRLRLATGTVAMLLMLGPVSIGVGAAQAQSSSSASTDKIVFHVGIPGDMVAPNPFKACCGYEYEMMFNAFDMLFNFKPADLTPAPGLATKCVPDADNLVWTCTIRSGVKWSDGQPLTSKDIAFTYKFILDHGLSSFSDYLPYNPTFETPNDTTLIWKSEKPTFAPTVPPWVPILPEHIWKQFEGDGKAARGFDNLPAVGSGPFALTSWTPGQGWTMEANKHYWNGVPTIDEIQYKVYDNQEAMVQALKSGQIDFADSLTPTLFNSLKGQPNIGLVKALPQSFTNLAFNFGGQGPDATNNPVLKDLKVRQAIAMAINKQAIIDKVWQGDAVLGSVVTLPSRPQWFITPNDVDTQAYNPDAANTLLDQAGYDKKDGDGIRLDKNGKPIVLNIITLPEETGSVDTGKLIAADLQHVGIGVKLQSMSDKQVTNNNWYNGDFDAYVWGWGGDPDPNFILSIFITSQCLGWSDGCYSDPTFDQMFAHQSTLLDHTQRAAYIGQMQQYIYDQIPEIVLNYANWLQAYRTDRFTGYVPEPSNGGTILFGWGNQYQGLKPVVGSATASSSGGIPAAVWIVLGVVVVLGGAFYVITRGRRKEEEA